MLTHRRWVKSWGCASRKNRQSFPISVESLERREQLSRLAVAPQSFFQGSSSLDVTSQVGWREVGAETSSGEVARIGSEGASGSGASLDYRSVSDAGRTIALSTFAIADPRDGVGSANAWLSTQGQYDGGGLLFSILPSPGQVAGDPVRLKLGASYLNTNAQETVGRNYYSVSYDQVDDAGGRGTPLLNDVDSRLLPGQDPVKRSIEIDTTVGSTFRIFMTLESSSTQAGQPAGQLIVDIETTGSSGDDGNLPDGSTPSPGSPPPPTAPGPGSGATVGADTTPPWVTAISWSGGQKERLRMRIVFSEAMHPTTAVNAGNYRLSSTINGRSRRLRVRSATYDPQTNSVEITLFRQVSSRRSLNITVAGVHDLAGNGLRGGHHTERVRV